MQEGIHMWQSPLLLVSRLLAYIINSGGSPALFLVLQNPGRISLFVSPGVAPVLSRSPKLSYSAIYYAYVRRDLYV